MPRKKTQDAPVPKTTVSADDFLAELEASEDALELDESEEVVTEDDIMAELSASGSPEEPVPDVHAYPGLLPDTGSANVLPVLTEISETVTHISETLRDVKSRSDRTSERLGIMEHSVEKAMETLATRIETLSKQVHVVETALTTLAEAVSSQGSRERTAPAAKPKTETKADTFVEKPAAKPAGAVDAYMLKEISTIVSAFPSGFKTDIPRLAKVIHAKRFAGDPAALPKVEVLCRDHLGALGSVKDGVFTRTASPPIEEDIEL